MVYREEGSRKSAPLSNGSTASGLVKSPTRYSLGKRSPSLYDQLMSQKPVEPSPNIPVDQDAESSGEEAETSVSDPYDSDQDDYGQFVQCFNKLGL